ALSEFTLLMVLGKPDHRVTLAFPCDYVAILFNQMSLSTSCQAIYLNKQCKHCWECALLCEYNIKFTLLMVLGKPDHRVTLAFPCDDVAFYSIKCLCQQVVKPFI
ncbi:MAG: hypothetical protein RSA24_03035, partial [Clostridia bacterium]